MAKKIGVSPLQLKLFHEDLPARVRLNGIVQFRRGDKFYDHAQPDEAQQPTLIEITSDKKYQGPASTVEYVRYQRSGTEAKTMEAAYATKLVDEGKWKQVSDNAAAGKA